MTSKSILLAAAVAVVGACASAPQPGEPGYRYNLDGRYSTEFAADDGQVYTGSMQLATEPGGAVTGTMALASPAAVDGQATGTIVGAQLELRVEYFIADAQCGGVATVTATIAEGGDSATGSAVIANDADCAGGPTSASVNLTR